MIWLLLMAQAEVPEPINLVCYGGGTHRGFATSTGTVSNGFDSATIRSQHQTRESYTDQVNLELKGETGRIRVPNGVMPLLTYGGDDGWYQLKKVEYGKDEIKAKFSLNFMNSPQVRLDRITGRISIRAKAGSFEGPCERYDAETVQRKF